MLHLEARAPESISLPHRLGTLVWWTFREASTPLPELARTALETGFPPLFLGVPATPRTALRRALRALTVGHREWHADILCDDEEAMIAALEHWDPRAEPPARPWRVALRLRIDERGPSRGLHIDNLRIDDGTTSCGDIVERVRERYSRELESVSATEIGRGLVAALENHDGVELRRGLWFVPPVHDLELARAAVAYVRRVGSSSAGTADYFADAAPTDPKLAKARQRLDQELSDLESRLRDAPALDALRWPPLWHAVERFERRLGTLEVALCGDLDAYRSPAGELRRALLRRAAHAGDAFVQSVGREVTADLWLGLEKIRRGAAAGSVDELATGESLLAGALPAARAGGFEALADRLCHLSAATVDLYHATLERPAARETPPRIRHAALKVTLESLFEALGDAARDLTERARQVYPTLFEHLESVPA